MANAIPVDDFDDMRRWTQRSFELAGAARCAPRPRRVPARTRVRWGGGSRYQVTPVLIILCCYITDNYNTIITSVLALIMIHTVLTWLLGLAIALAVSISHRNGTEKPQSHEAVPAPHRRECPRH